MINPFSGEIRLTVKTADDDFLFSRYHSFYLQKIRSENKKPEFNEKTTDLMMLKKLKSEVNELTLKIHSASKNKMVNEEE